MVENGPDPEALGRLASLKPRDELVQRLVLREAYQSLYEDPLFKERIKFLLEMLNPAPGEMAAIMAEARAIGRGEAPPPVPPPIENMPVPRRLRQGARRRR